MIKRYLFIGHWESDVLFSDQLEKKDLIDLVGGSGAEQIIDLKLGKSFDKESNKWVDIEDKKVY